VNNAEYTKVTNEEYVRVTKHKIKSSLRLIQGSRLTGKNIKKQITKRRKNPNKKII